MSKEYILEKNEGNTIITKYGTHLNAIKPNVIYLRSKAKIRPLIDKDTFEKEIIKIKNDFNKYVEKQVINNKMLYNNFLSSIDISTKSVKYGKISFLRYDVYLKPVIIDTLEKNIPLFNNLINKIDKKLIKLLLKNNIECI